MGDLLGDGLLHRNADLLRAGAQAGWLLLQGWAPTWAPPHMHFQHPANESLFAHNRGSWWESVEK